MSGDVTDESLVRLAKGGDLAAFEQLVARHERRIYALARRIVRHPEDAEDVTQQAFLSVLEHLEGFREEARFTTWLTRIATHAALKVLRKQRGLDVVPLEPAAGSEEAMTAVPVPEFIADWSEAPDVLASRHETRLLVEEALAQLDDKHRLVFLLRDVEGLTVREAAEALGLSEANVKVRLLRARLQLRERLTAAFGDPARRYERAHAHPLATP